MAQLPSPVPRGPNDNLATAETRAELRSGEPAKSATARMGARAVNSGKDEYVQVHRDTLDAVTELISSGHVHDEQLRAAPYQQGRQAHLAGGYQTGFALGHDTGLSARQNTRAYVHGILDGFQAGCDQRHQLVEQRLRRDQARHSASQRQPAREAEASRPSTPPT
jgi:flagellar biosynthesis/type III secretory pathway protein FliH